ncbi:MAG: hypothetical protein ACRDL7_04845, partial [Gaiellaceae bacterium]
RLESTFTAKMSANIIWSVFLDSRRFFSVLTDNTDLSGRAPLPTSNTGTLYMVVMSVQLGTDLSLMDCPPQLIGVTQAKPKPAASSGTLASGVLGRDRQSPNPREFTDEDNPVWHPTIRKEMMPVLQEVPHVKLTTICKAAGLRNATDLPQLPGHRICFRWVLMGKCFKECTNGSHDHLPIPDLYALQLLAAIKPGLDTGAASLRKRPRK